MDGHRSTRPVGLVSCYTLSHSAFAMHLKLALSESGVVLYALAAP